MNVEGFTLNKAEDFLDRALAELEDEGALSELTADQVARLERSVARRKAARKVQRGTD